MSSPMEILADYHCHLHNVGAFLQDVLPKESLSLETEEKRLKCVAYIAEVTNALAKAELSGGKTLLNAGLSRSNQSLDKVNDLEIEDNIPRSESLPNISSTASQGMDDQVQIPEICENGDVKESPSSSPEDGPNGFKQEKEEFIDDDYDDDGFATDEFESGSSEGDTTAASPLASPSAGRKGKKKKRLLKWLKKKGKRDKSFSNLQEGIVLAGYISKCENNACNKRWCIIRDGKFFCYKNIKDDNSELVLELEGAEVKPLEGDDKRQFSFCIVQDGLTKIVLVAKNQKDMERWLKALRLESGFIRLASPVDTSSGVYEHEEADDMYITPLSPVGITRIRSFSGEIVTKCPPSPTSSPVVSPINPSPKDGDDDLYMEVLPPQNATVPPRKLSREDLGPLPPPPVPPERPGKPKAVEELEKVVKRESVCDSDVSGEFEEIYEVVSESVSQSDDKQKSVAEPAYVAVSDSGKTEQEMAALPQDKVSRPVGIEDGTIPDSAITSSSNLMYTARACLARLNRKPEKTEMGSWCAKNNTKSQHLQVDLGEVIGVCGIATQGRADFTDNGGWYVKTFRISHSKDGKNWSSYRESGMDKVFQANTDHESVVINSLERSLNTRYLRIIPQSWHNHIAMRIEVYSGETGLERATSYDKCSITETETSNVPLNEDSVPKTVVGKACLTRKVSFDEKVQVIKDKYSERHRPAVESKDNMTDSRREASQEEVEIDKMIKQMIQSRQQTGDNTTSRQGVFQSIIARKSLYEGGSVSNTDSEGEPEKSRKVGTNDNDVTAADNDLIPQLPLSGETSQNEYQDPDKEREVLEQTEKAFRNYAHHLNKEGGEAIKKKRPSLVALNKINFEHPKAVEQQQQKDKSRPQRKTEGLMREKASITSRVEVLKRRIQVAKDRKIFFSMSSANSHAFADAETEFHEAQLELAKAKKRLCEIESELKTQRVLEFRFQKTPEFSLSQSPKKELQRKNSRECKLVSDHQRPNVDPKSFNPEGELAAKGSVLSQIKAFETLKKK